MSFRYRCRVDIVCSGRRSELRTHDGGRVYVGPESRSHRLKTGLAGGCMMETATSGTDVRVGGRSSRRGRNQHLHADMPSAKLRRSTRKRPPAESGHKQYMKAFALIGLMLVAALFIEPMQSRAHAESGHIQYMIAFALFFLLLVSALFITLMQSRADAASPATRLKTVGDAYT